jgi:spore maturation protein CgeB
LKGLADEGHEATFFERDVDYYAQHRDLAQPPFCKLELYTEWSEVLPRARKVLAQADVAMVTSYCPDGIAACQLVLGTRGPLRVFYDMDTPVTLAALGHDGLAIASGAHYLTPELIPEFDLYLSFSGGPVLDCLKSRWGARRTAALYGSVDPTVHTPVANPPQDLVCALGYLGTYAADRQAALERLLIEAARQRLADRFLVVGSLYPDDLVWPANVSTRPHLDPAEHPAFYSANRLTLSVSRRAMREWGYTPSGRLFEATSCGTPVVTDRFPGLDEFFTPGLEILVADTTEDVVAALELSETELTHIAEAGRERTLSEHTGSVRAKQLIAACEAVLCSA